MKPVHDEPSVIYPSERILPDDYPVFPAYLYVADGRVIRSMIHGTVRELKADIPAKEIRSCDMSERDLF